MAEWLEQVSQWHEMYCHDLEPEFEPQSGRTWGAQYAYFCLSCRPTWTQT